MQRIKGFLEKFKKFTFPNKEIREQTQKILLNDVGVEISIQKISVRGNTIYLNTTPLLKNEIFLHKEKILSKLEEAFKEKAPRDIR